MKWLVSGTDISVSSSTLNVGRYNGRLMRQHRKTMGGLSRCGHLTHKDRTPTEYLTGLVQR
ncbi:hypothetical protein ACRRTK_009646 [Alexandromys fortis]